MTSRRVVILSYPIHDQQTKVIGAVAVAVDLLDYDSVHYKSALENARLPQGSVVTIVDSMGNVVARWPNANRWVGYKANDIEVFRRIQAASNTESIQAVGMDGVKKLYHYMAIPDTDWYLYIGIPISTIINPTRAALYQTLLLGVVVLIIAMLLASYFSGLIRRPLSRLHAVVAAATNGQISARADVEGPREFTEFGQHFNDMLAARARVEAALAKEKEQAEVTLAAIGDAVIRTASSGERVSTIS